MICYKCDMCNQEIEGHINTFEMFPRKTIRYERNVHGIKTPMNTYTALPTHLCDDCFRKIVNMMLIVKEKD